MFGEEVDEGDECDEHLHKVSQCRKRGVNKKASCF